jgi:hypothetical protein
MKEILNTGDIFLLPKTIKSVIAGLPAYFSHSKVKEFSEETSERHLSVYDEYSFDPSKVADIAVNQAIETLRKSLPLSTTNEVLNEEIYSLISQYLPFTDTRIFDSKELFWFYQVTEVTERCPRMTIMRGMSDRNKLIRAHKSNEEDHTIDTGIFPQFKYQDTIEENPKMFYDKSQSKHRQYHLVTARRLRLSEIPHWLLDNANLNADHKPDPNSECLVQTIKFYQKGRGLYSFVSPEQIEVFKIKK